LTGVTDDMLIQREETFGPITSVEVVDSPAEAIHRANQSPYGLVASVFTTNVDAAISFADQLHAGMVHVNGMTIQQEPQAPFGGVGDSGFGREGIDAAIEEMTEWKWITIDQSRRT
jgi:acyl-CoA reductase-like NAD-dependent aldehyde dehydrogenase